LYLTPMTEDRRTAAKWLERFEGAGLDGVVAKPADASYQAGKRAMIKVKHARTADCVVAGFRWHKTGTDAVGSLLLGLFDGRGATFLRWRPDKEPRDCRYDQLEVTPAYELSKVFSSGSRRS